MSRQRFVLLLLAALLAICGALYLSSQRNLARDLQGAALFPQLAKQFNTVTELTVRKGGPAPTLTLHKRGDTWTVAERADYPADVSKLRKLLLALSDATIREEKTSNPANFAVIGVEDPSSPGATGTQIDLTAGDGTHGVVVGKPVGAGSFVRRVGENTSYIVEPGISVEAEPRFWIDTHLLDLAAAAIQSLDVKPATGPAYVVHRGSAPNGIFTLDSVPGGRTAIDAQRLAPSPTTFSGLVADDVAPAGNIDFTNASSVALTLSDGNRVTITGALSGAKRWIEIASTQDAALNAKTQGRAFEISNYRYDAIFRPLEQLLIPKQPPPEAKKPAAAPRS